jgi:thiamine-phosphate pyrophosphorylase
LNLNFKLYLITDRKLCQESSLEEIVRQALAAGIKAVQLREKDLNTRELFETGKNLKNLTDEYQSKLFINDRLDLLLSLDAAGIQIPEDGIPISQIKSHAAGKQIGASVHSIDKALAKEQEGADFLLFGPVFETESKKGILEPQGLSNLSEVAASVKVPVLAVGGITPERAEKCLQHGAAGAAVISAILKSKNIPQTISEFKHALGEL